MKLLFTGCEHYGHTNIIKYCNRPFSNTEEMDSTIIKNCNSRAKTDDLVYHLGDFCLHSNNNRGNGKTKKAIDYIKQLKCENIFINGNHDEHQRNTLKTKNQEIILQVKKLKIQLIHDPKFAKIDYDLTIHSHVHLAWKVNELKYCGNTTLLINCGVDVNDFKPISLDEILTIYYKWLIVKKDYKKCKAFLIEQNKGTKIE